MKCDTTTYQQKSEPYVAILWDKSSGINILLQLIQASYLGTTLTMSKIKVELNAVKEIFRFMLISEI